MTTQRRVQTNFTGASAIRRDTPWSTEPEQYEPVTLVPADPETVPQGTAREVLGWVGTDADRAGRALDAEQTSSDPRKVLMTALTKLSGRASVPQEQPQQPAAPQETAPTAPAVP